MEDPELPAEDSVLLGCWLSSGTELPDSLSGTVSVLLGELSFPESSGPDPEP